MGFTGLYLFICLPFYPLFLCLSVCLSPSFQREGRQACPLNYKCLFETVKSIKETERLWRSDKLKTCQGEKRGTEAEGCRRGGRGQWRNSLQWSRFILCTAWLLSAEWSAQIYQGALAQPNIWSVRHFSSRTCRSNDSPPETTISNQNKWFGLVSHLLAESTGWLTWWRWPWSHTDTELKPSLRRDTTGTNSFFMHL